MNTYDLDFNFSLLDKIDLWIVLFSWVVEVDELTPSISIASPFGICCSIISNSLMSSCLTSHILTVLSEEPDARILPSWLNDNELTVFSWPYKLFIFLPEPISQILIILSSPNIWLFNKIK